MKYKLFIIIIIVISFVFFWTNYLKNRNFTGSDIEVNTLVSNKTWDINYTDKVFYKKWDTIEYVFVIKNKSEKNKKLNVLSWKIHQDFWLDNPVIELQDSIVSWDQATILKISWVSSSRWDTSDKSNLVNDIVTFENIDETLQSSNSNIWKNDLIDSWNQSQASLSSNNSIPVATSVVWSTFQQWGWSSTNSISNSWNNINNTLENSINTWSSSTVTTGWTSTTITTWSQSTIKNKDFSSDIDNLFKVNSSLTNIKSVWIGEKFFNVIVLENEPYIYIPKKTFSSWTYFMNFILTNWEMVASNDVVDFSLWNKSVEILKVFPNKFPNNTDRWITVQWIGLKKTVSVQLSNNTIFKKTDFQIVSDNVLAVKIPINIDPGNYYINIMTLDWIYEFPNKTFNIYFKSN